MSSSTSYDPNWFTRRGFRSYNVGLDTEQANGAAARMVPLDGRPNYTLKDLDAIFLRQLGVDISNPLTTAPNVTPMGLVYGDSYENMHVVHPLPNKFLMGRKGDAAPFTEYRKNLADLGYRSTGAGAPVIGAEATQVESRLQHSWAYAPEIMPDMISATRPFGRQFPGQYLPGKYFTLGSMRLAVAERVINDFRMSLLGASPDYDGKAERDGVPEPTFAPLDLDGDGRVMCSAYNAQPHWLKLSERSDGNLGLTSWAPDSLAAVAVLFPVKSVADLTMDQCNGLMEHYDLYRFAWASTAGAAGPLTGNDAESVAVEFRPFSVNGVFTLRKSHFYRVWIRGELWDDLLSRPVTQVNMDSAVCADPSGDGSQVSDLTILYQREWYNRYGAQLSGGHN